jgi:hypothetical protein
LKIEYLHAGSPECPVIRLCDFDIDGAQELRELFQSLANGNESSIALHNLNSFSAVDHVRLFLSTASKDFGIVRISNQLRGFDLRLTRATFADLAELTVRFENLEHSGAFQWLSELGAARLLLSPSGWW